MAQAWPVFDALFRPWMASRVRVQVAGGFDRYPAERPLLLCANHESWWDGFVLRQVQLRLRRRARFYSVMLDSELRRRPFLKPLGAIGLDPGSTGSVRGMLRRLRHLAGNEPDAVVAYFPQGEIRPGSPRPLGFRRGVSAVCKSLSPVTVAPVGLRLLPGRTTRMHAFVSVGDPVFVTSAEPLSRSLIEALVADELDAVNGFVARHGEHAADRWPEDGRPLPRASEAAWAPKQLENWISAN